MSDDKVQKAMSGSPELEIRFDGSKYMENAKDSPRHQPISCNIGEEFEKNLPGLGGKVKVLKAIKMLFSLSLNFSFSIGTGEKNQKYFTYRWWWKWTEKIP